MQNAALSEDFSPLAEISRDLLARQPDDRIPTMIEYQERLGIGSGTVQARLRVLASIGAIQLQARGHQGTLLVARDLSALWNLSRLGPVRGVLPLPEALEPVSLAVVIRRAFQRLKIPVELLYLHGSANRIELVHQGAAHFTVVSRPAVEVRLLRDSERWLTRDLGPESYHREDSMVVLIGADAATDNRIVKVGIDPDSYDHTLLTRLEFPTAQGYVHSSHPHGRLPAAVAEGVIDAAVWLRTTLAIPLSAVGIVARPLSRPDAIQANRAFGYAVLVAPVAELEVASVLREIDLSAAPRVQEEILQSGVLPLY